MTRTEDPFGIDRFVRAQDGQYDVALAEIRAGRKRSHWMWYVFPQVAGLGSSAMSRRYAIGSATEAKAYLEHPLLGPRLIEISAAVLALQARSAQAIFGSPDDRKLQSCATLFASVSSSGSVFERLLGQYFDGERDARTLELLRATATQEGAGRSNWCPPRD
jgi:uncharacterized protein (DUF1810 family)